MSTGTTLHVSPTGSGEWAIKINETTGASSILPSLGQAIGRAFELAHELLEAEADILVYEADGRIGSSLRMHRYRPSFDRPAALILDEGLEDSTLRTRAESITPRRVQLDAMIARGSTSTIDYSLEDDEPPC